MALNLASITARSFGSKLPQVSSVCVRYKSDKEHHEPKHDLINRSRVRGIDILRNPKLNKGTAYTLRERQLMGIHGLVPPCVRTMEEQKIRVLTNFAKRSSDLDRFIYLMSLQDRNEKLFYKVLTENVEQMMPIVYTPTVGLACQQYGVVFRRPRGLFISIKDKGHIYDILCNWPERNVKAIVVTDGERILGLGDLGAYGMGIPVGKLSLYTALGGINPAKCLPILLDVGTNNKKLHDDPLYIGRNQKRVTGQEYDDFIDEFMQAVARRYGYGCLIQFEDFGNQNAFRFLEKYRNKYCTFNDDIQGTASVAAAGVFASLRITGKKLEDNKYLLLGAGEANIGIAQLLVLAMTESGIPVQEARNKIWLIDSKGLLVKNRPNHPVTGHKKDFAKDFKPMTNLEEIVNELKPTALIGASAQPGAFNENVIRSMAKHNARPVIFALSNPTSMAECTAEQAYSLTEGRAVFASGSPFPQYNHNGQIFHPGQGNNAYIFPGVALGILTCGIRHVSDLVFLRAAQKLATLVTEDHLKEGRLYPPLNTVQDVSLKIATDLAEYVYKNNMASAYPEPADKEAYIRSFMYDPEYESFEPETWDWPDN
ncbi:NADP-dependent malic enzyme [Biomphalaria glabrata]|nr:NADP-dependent malic enzyme [Biomphalaria glabrata]